MTTSCLRLIRIKCISNWKPNLFGRFLSRVASFGISPYHQQAQLASLTRHGFVSADAVIPRFGLVRGIHVYLGHGTTISRTDSVSEIRLGDNVQIYGNAFLEVGAGALIEIGMGSHIQPGCHIHAHINSIRIGEFVEIGPNCAFYSYNHGISKGCMVMHQALESKGEISIGGGSWLGHGVVVLDGVVVGKNAIIGAGSVVTHNIPENAIAAGIPAKVIRFRNN